MNKSEPIYKTSTASVDQILLHLKDCKDDFRPPLDQTVNLSEYAKKIGGNAITFEAWLDNKLVGLVAAYFNDIKSHSGYITHVGVLGDYKGKGIALQLMNRCIDFAIQNSFDKITLEVASDNVGATQLYKKLNFTIFEIKGQKTIMILSLTHLKKKQDGQQPGL